MIGNLHLSICILCLFDGTLDIKLSNVLSESKFSPRAYIYILIFFPLISVNVF